VDRMVAALNQDSKPMRGSKVLVCGLAYKPNIDDTRETPAAEIIELLADLGAQVSYHDPHVPNFPPMRKHKIEMKSVDLTPAVVKGFDCVVIVTDHAAVDYKVIADSAKLVVDTRNALKGMHNRGARVVKA